MVLLPVACGQPVVAESLDWCLSRGVTYRAGLLGLEAVGEGFDAEDCCDFVHEGLGVAGSG